MATEIKVSSILADVIKGEVCTSDIAVIRQNIIAKIFSMNMQNELIALAPILSNNEIMQKLIDEHNAKVTTTADNDNDSFINVDTPQIASSVNETNDIPELTLNEPSSPVFISHDDVNVEVVDVKPDVKPDINVEVADVKPEVKPDVKPEVKPEAKLNAANMDFVNENFALFNKQAENVYTQLRELCNNVDSKITEFHVTTQDLKKQINELKKQNEHVEDILRGAQNIDGGPNTGVEQVLRAKINEITEQKAKLTNELMTWYKWFAQHAKLRESLDNQHVYDKQKRPCDYRQTPEYKETYQIMLKQLQTCCTFIETNSDNQITFAVVSNDTFKNKFMKPIWTTLTERLIKHDENLEQYLNNHYWMPIVWRTVLSYFDLSYYIVFNSDGQEADILIIPQNDSQRYYVNTPDIQHGNYFYNIRRDLFHPKSSVMLRNLMEPTGSTNIIRCDASCNTHYIGSVSTYYNRLYNTYLDTRNKVYYIAI